MNLCILDAEFAKFEYTELGKVELEGWKEQQLVINLDNLVYLSPSDDYENIFVLGMSNALFMISEKTRDEIIKKISWGR